MVMMRKEITSSETVKIAQLNAQNSRTVINELRRVLEERGIDVIALQEPYNRDGVVGGLGLTTKVVSDATKFSRSVSSNNVKSAIAILNPNIKVLKLSHLCNTHVTCTQIISASNRFYLVSAYMQFSEPIGPYLQQLEKIIRKLQGMEIIFCLDTNAKSVSWFSKVPGHSRIADQRGEELEEFIAQHRLNVINKPGNAPTFDNIHGRSNIDVTLATNAIARKINKWTVHPHETISDHSLITFEVNKKMVSTRTEVSNRFNTKRADWDAYRSLIRNLLQQHIPHNNNEEYNTDAQTLSEKIDKVILEAANKSIPRKKTFNKSVPWWNQDLTKLREKVLENRRKLQRTKDATARKRLTIEFRKIRKKYISAIHEAKKTSWEKFVTKEGNRYPWSIIYKMQTKRLKIETAQSNINNNDMHTTTWDQTMDTLLNVLIPSDNSINESAWQQSTRLDTRDIPNTIDAPPFTMQELLKIIKDLNVRKTPGHDLIEAKMLKEAWPEIQADILQMFNCCLEQGVFPRQYKLAQIRALLKSADKDPTDPKTYRPISLLPVIGKVLEKLIAGRMGALANEHPKSSSRQYGFRPRRSTEDAIVELNRIVSATQGKYAVGLLFDISGAFDNVWWPSILRALKERECPGNIYRLIQSYLTDRRALMIGSTKSEFKNITKGCPQGSVLGPMFWNLIFDEAIDIAGRGDNQPIAFADDLIVVVSANSRQAIETKANRITQELVAWCEKQKLEISKKKSEMLLLKGFLDIKRPPVVKIGNTSMKMNPKARYLGIIFGSRLSISPHIDYITAKTKRLFAGFSKLAREHWGLNTKVLRTIYTGLVLPVLCYAAAGWVHRLNTHHTRKLKSAQRQALIAITRAYRTTSNNALAVLAAELPIHLALKEKVQRYNLRKNREVAIGNLRLDPSEHELDEESREGIRNEIRAEVIRMWQEEWNSSEHGCVTKSFFPQIRERLECKDLQIDHYSTQLITGHGYINITLSKLNLTESNLCRCGQLDTVDHIIFHCNEEEAERAELINELNKEGIEWPCNYKDLVKRETFPYLARFANVTIKKRREIELRSTEQ